MPKSKRARSCRRPGPVISHNGKEYIKKNVYIYMYIYIYMGFPGGSDGKESACNAGDRGLIPRLGRSPGKGNGNPFGYSCLENPMDRGAWRAIVHGLAKSWTQLSDYESESHAVVSNSLQPHGLYSPWNSPGKNTGVGCHCLLQEILPTQGSNPGLLHCRQVLYHKP